VCNLARFHIRRTVIYPAKDTSYVLLPLQNDEKGGFVNLKYVCWRAAADPLMDLLEIGSSADDDMKLFQLD
jgi:hypothetical protein